MWCECQPCKGGSSLKPGNSACIGQVRRLASSVGHHVIEVVAEHAERGQRKLQALARFQRPSHKLADTGTCSHRTGHSCLICRLAQQLVLHELGRVRVGDVEVDGPAPGIGKFGEASGMARTIGLSLTIPSPSHRPYFFRRPLCDFKSSSLANASRFPIPLTATRAPSWGLRGRDLPRSQL